MSYSLSATKDAKEGFEVCPDGKGSFRRKEAFAFRDKSRGSVYINFRRIRTVNISILKPLTLFYFKGGRDQQEKKKSVSHVDR